MLIAMFMMVLLTLIIGIVTVTVRIKNVKKSKISRKYFRLMQGENLPDVVIKTTRNFNNQFELPVLFYVVCTLFISLKIESEFALYIAIVFVISRYFHAVIHITYNNVIHRMISFFIGFICVIAMWVNLVIIQS
ncbi:hypothetical protein CJF42_13075 [Pseudoalteromonas sp. NBT06-2]|uniref:MAPEG family protein n=1 Tax=Pseudoalteromonas sp. NBT06-2 TaxID=2025950 RepID=UPI000BA6926A|nr:MAPEG family protein [Pseudoalteromonas sp. NBT06-2]PAJ73982.1 hypothetical protein CJF42_13075 [Pseudoalteromonas sp. NBT06-2]